MWTSLVTADRGCLIFNIIHSAVCVHKCSVSSHSLTLHTKRGRGLSLWLKMIFNVLCQVSTTSWVLIYSFSFSSWHLYTCNNGSQLYICYICGNVVLISHKKSLTLWRKHSVTTLESNQGIRIGHSLLTFAVKNVWRTWEIKGMLKERVSHLPFQLSGRKEGKDHITNCYFCMINIYIASSSTLFNTPMFLLL